MPLTVQNIILLDCTTMVVDLLQKLGEICLRFQLFNCTPPGRLGHIGGAASFGNLGILKICGIHLSFKCFMPVVLAAIWQEYLEKSIFGNKQVEAPYTP